MKKAEKKSVARNSHKVIQKIVKAVKKVKVTEPETEQVAVVEVHVRVEPQPTPSYPVYDHIQITEVLEGGHTKTHLHCRGVDRKGTKLTLHVPRELFR